MATIRQRNGNWTVSIRRQGNPPQYATFDTKSDAVAWSANVETEMRRGVFTDTTLAEKTTLKTILERYRDEISVSKKGVVQEKSKIKMICKHPITDKMIIQITTADITLYRNNRLSGYNDVKSVGTKTVREEMQILDHTFKIAKTEWAINLPKGNPVTDVRKPAEGNGKRDRRLKTSPDKALCEESRLLSTSGKYGNMESVITLAIETAMRRSELSGLTWDNIHLDKQYAHLPNTKNGQKRDVPLSSIALTILRKLKKDAIENEELVLNMKADFITHSFIKICREANINDLRFHDLRHEATSRLVEQGLNILEVSSITGHNDLQMLKRYTHFKATDLAKKLK